MSDQTNTQWDDFMSPRFFRALGDPTRASLVRMLAEAPQACTVSELTDQCSVGMSAVSRHLAVLRDAGIVRSERRGKEVYYQVCEQDILGVLQRMTDYLKGCFPNS